MLIGSAVRRAVATVALTCAVLTAQAHPSTSELEVGSQAIARRATVCNGHAELCNRSFGNVTFVGTHDSYAIGVDSVMVNQDQPIMQQLNDGIRMLQMQAHNENGVIRLCHSDCKLLDGGTLEDYLKIVKQWLDANPNEVLSLLIVNIDNLPATAYDTVFKSVGLDTISYAPPSLTLPASGWPTLGSLIDSGKRLLTFLDNAADFTAAPYLLDEFTNIWETAFNVVDPTFDCNVNRTKGDTGTQMYIINHFLDKMFLGAPIPYPDKANVTNSATGFGSIGAQVDTCLAAHGRPPNFILLDFYEFGGGAPFQVAAGINGVPYNPTTPVATRVSAATSTAGATGTKGPSASGSSSLPSGKSSAMTHSFGYYHVFALLSTLAAISIGPLVTL